MHAQKCECPIFLPSDLSIFLSSHLPSNTRTFPMTPRARLPLIAGLALLLVLAVYWGFGGKKPEVRYNGKTLSEWFFGQRRDFFYQSIQTNAEQTFRAMGTNAFPFLLSMLEERGNSTIYFKFYRMMPRPVQARLQHPLSRDDIQMMALHYLDSIPIIPDPVPEELLSQLARRVARLPNARVRLW